MKTAQPELVSKGKEAKSARESTMRTTPTATAPAAAIEVGALPQARPEPGQSAAAMADSRGRNAPAGAGRMLQARAGVAGMGGGVVGGAVGGVVDGVPREQREPDLQKALALSVAETPTEAILQSVRDDGVVEESKWKKIGDRIFRFYAGYWIDERCNGNPHAELVATKAGSAEYDEILKANPDLRKLIPVMIYWKDKIHILR